MSPRIGDQVRFLAARDDGGTEELVAFVVRVWSENVVNLCVLTAEGRAAPETSVWRDESDQPATRTWHAPRGA